MSWKLFLQITVHRLAAFIDSWFYYIVGGGILLALYNTFIMKDWDKELFLAIRANDKDKVQKALDNYADVNCKQTQYDCTPLIAAAHKNHTDILELLLKQRGVDVKLTDANGSTALHFAAISGALNSAKLLLKCKADVKASDNDGNTPLILATDHGHADVVKVLLSHGAESRWKNRKGVNAVHAALNKHHEEGGRMECIKLLIRSPQDVESKTPSGWTPLIKSAYLGYTDVMNFLLKKGASIDAQSTDGFTALIAAAQNGRTNAVRMLLKHGADPSLTSKDGSTALVRACYGGYQEIIILLVAHKKQCVNLSYNNGSTPLMAACARGFIGAVRVLLAHDADVNAQNIEGWTALSIATDKGFYKIVELLIENGAALDPCTGKGFTPLMISITSSHDHITKLLLQHKATVNHFYLEEREQQTELKDDEAALVLKSRAKQPDGSDFPFIFGYIPPLHLAIATENNKAIVELLLDHDADVDFNIHPFRTYAKEPYDLRPKVDETVDDQKDDEGPSNSDDHPFMINGKPLTKEQQKAIIEEVEEKRLQEEEEFEQRSSEITQTSAVYTFLSTAVIFATYLNRIETLELIFRKRPNVDLEATNAAGETALDIALDTGNTDAAILLLKQGVRYSILQKYGWSHIRFSLRMLWYRHWWGLARFHFTLLQLWKTSSNTKSNSKLLKKKIE